MVSVILELIKIKIPILALVILMLLAHILKGLYLLEVGRVLRIWLKFKEFRYFLPMAAHKQLNLSIL
jgi:hypothetical protein